MTTSLLYSDNKQSLEERFSQAVVTGQFFIRSTTNGDELAKQYFSSIKNESIEPTLLIRKLVLSSDYKCYKRETLLRQYKDKGLFEMRFGIKISTLKTVIQTLNLQLNENKR